MSVRVARLRMLISSPASCRKSFGAAAKTLCGSAMLARKRAMCRRKCMRGYELVPVSWDTVPPIRVAIIHAPRMRSAPKITYTKFILASPSFCGFPCAVMNLKRENRECYHDHGTKSACYEPLNRTKLGLKRVFELSGGYIHGQSRKKHHKHEGCRKSYETMNCLPSHSSNICPIS